MMTFNEPVTCRDGYRVSVQASRGHYCEPRYSDEPLAYQEVELGYPSAPDPLLEGWAEDESRPTETVYPYVPVHLVRELLANHGGVESGTVPYGVYEDASGQLLLQLLR